MRINAVLGAFAGALTVALGAITYRLHSDHAVFEANRQALLALEKPAPRPARQRPRVSTETLPVAASSAAPVRPVPPGSALTNERREAMRQRARDRIARPEFQNRRLEMNRREMRRELKDVGLWVSLPPDKMEALTALLLEQRQNGVRVAPGDLDKAREELRMKAIEHRAQVVELIGENAARQLDAYRAAEFERNHLSELNRRVAAADGLTARAFQQAAAAMTQAHQRAVSQQQPPQFSRDQLANDPAANREVADRRFQSTQASLDQMQAAAAPHLSPRQKAMLDQMFRERLDKLRVDDEIDRLGWELTP